MLEEINPDPNQINFTNNSVLNKLKSCREKIKKFIDTTNRTQKIKKFMKLKKKLYKTKIHLFYHSTYIMKRWLNINQDFTK